MISNLLYAIVLAVLFNCVISVAKNSGKLVENTSNNVTPENINENIYSEGNSLVSSSKSRIKPRKGAIPDKSTENITPSDTANITQDANKNLDKNIISDVLSSNATQDATSIVNTSSISNVTVPSIFSSTLKVEISSKSTTSSSTRTFPARKKSVKKPTVTYSADDSAQILESEKNIKYINVTTNIEDVNIPKTSSDTDRTIVEEEQRTRRNYILYMGLAFALPLAFTLIHLSYKKIRNWMEIRHYERVVRHSSSFSHVFFIC